MSDRSGYSPDFMEGLGRCRVCGGQKDYPMLVESANTVPGPIPPYLQTVLCRAKYHTIRFRISAAIYKWITGEEPKQ